MSDFNKWLGGPNFVKQKKWGNGMNNDGAGRRRLGLTKRRRFNPHVGNAEGYPNAPVNLLALADKKKFEREGKPTRYYKSGLIK